MLLPVGLLGLVYALPQASGFGFACAPDAIHILPWLATILLGLVMGIRRLLSSS